MGSDLHFFTHFISRYPRYVSSIPPIMLAQIYAVKPQMFPFWIIDRLSFAKVENVVKPPHSPVMSSRNQLLLVVRYRESKAYINPIRKQPARFTVRVPHGNDVLCPFINDDMRYLAAPPRKLPLPTIRIFSIITLCLYTLNPTVWQ